MAVQSESESAGTESLTVYFDGSCPVCSREINWYKKRQGSKDITWCDVSAIEDENVCANLKTDAALKRFHVRRGDGTLVDGAKAFSELWLNIPSLKLVGTLTRLPGIHHVAELLYKVFLMFRNRR